MSVAGSGGAAVANRESANTAYPIRKKGKRRIKNSSFEFQSCRGSALCRIGPIGRIGPIAGRWDQYDQWGPMGIADKGRFTVRARSPLRRVSEFRRLFHHL